MTCIHRRYFLLVGLVLILTLFVGSGRETAVLNAKQPAANPTILSSTFDTVSPPSLYPALSTQMVSSVLIIDGSFEEDPSAWTEQDTTDCLPWIGDWTIYGGPEAYDGVQYFWGGGACGPAGDVEANSNSAEQLITFQPIDTTLSFYYYLVRNLRDSVTLDDYGYVSIDETVVWQIDLIQANETNGWVNVMIDISDYAGQTVNLKFGGINGQFPGYGHIFYDFIEVSQDEISAPEVTISKTPDFQTIGFQETAVFTIEVANTGNVTLFNVQVTDEQTPACGGFIGQLNVDSSVSIECEATNVSEGFVNMAEVSGQASNGQPVFDSDTAEVAVINPDITIVMTPESQTIPEGGTANFDVSITNSGNVDLFNIVVTDPLVPDCNANIAQLSAGEVHSYNSSCSLDNVTQSFLNSIFVTGEDEFGTLVTDDAAAFVDVIDSGIAIAINPEEQTVANGDIATFNVFVFNIGGVDLTNVDVTSAQVSSCNKFIGDLAIGANESFPCTEVITDSLINIVTVTAINPFAGIQVQDSYAATVDMIDIDIETTVNPVSMESPGGLVSVDVVLTNNGNKDLSLDNITGTVFGDETDPPPSPLQNNSCLAGQTILADGGTFTCQFDIEVKGKAGDYDVVSEVTASDFESNEVSDSDSIAVELTTPPITHIYLPTIMNNYVYSEPNDKCAESFGINTNFAYEFLADDEDDWYLFELNAPANLTIELTNFLPIDGQLLVYYGPCNALAFLGNNGNFSATKTLALGNQPAGSYRIWVLNAGVTNIEIPYTLEVTTTP